MGFDEVARARMILASVGKGDAPTVEETVIGAMSWLLPPERPQPVVAAAAPAESTPTDAEQRLASVHSAVSAWLLPR